VSEDKKQVHYGGQAIIEGVMMRGRENFGVACRRKSNGEIVTDCEPVLSVIKKLQWLKKPFLRGTLMLIDSMALGMKALMFSAEIASEEEDSAKGTESADPSQPVQSDTDNGSRKQQVINGIAIGSAMVIALGLSVVLFMLIPAALAKTLKPWTVLHHYSVVQQRVFLGLIEGSIKMIILLGYVSSISMWSEIRRVFQYHGAEHKTINAFEAGEPLDVEHVQRYSTVHVRCGTSFLLLVIITSIVVFAFIPWNYLWQRVLLKLVLLPLVAGIAYEIIQLAGRRKESKLLRGVLALGLLMQRITTKEPSDDQVEVAIKSLQLVLDAEAAATPATT
jgi:uncharacterized protein YqhQ